MNKESKKRAYYGGGRPKSGRIRSNVTLKRGCHAWVRANKETVEAWAATGKPLPPPYDVEF